MTYIKQHISMHYKINISLMFLPVLIVMMLMVLSPPTYAGEANRSRRDDASGTTLIVKQVPTTIEQKTSGHIITNTGERFVVSRNTLIIGTNGKQIRYEKMPAPCQVELQYYKKSGHSVAHRIDIKSVSPDANTHILSETPI